jgi:hypothetical protein
VRLFVDSATHLKKVHDSDECDSDEESDYDEETLIPNTPDTHTKSGDVFHLSNNGEEYEEFCVHVVRTEFLRLEMTSGMLIDESIEWNGPERVRFNFGCTCCSYYYPVKGDYRGGADYTDIVYPSNRQGIRQCVIVHNTCMNVLKEKMQSLRLYPNYLVRKLWENLGSTNNNRLAEFVSEGTALARTNQFLETLRTHTHST